MEGFDVYPESGVVGEGDAVRVEIVVVNAGTDAGTLVATPHWDGKLVAKAAQEWDFVKGRRRTLAFEVHATSAGEHEVGVVLDPGETRSAPVRVLGPEPKVTAWRVDNPLCEDHLSVNVTVENVGGTRAVGFALDAYSVRDSDNRYLGRLGFAVPDLAPREKAVLAGRVFAPFDCANAPDLRLELILTKDGKDVQRLRTDAFHPIGSAGG